EPTGQSAFDLNLQIFATGDTLRAAWHYASTLVHRADIERWRQDFLQVLDTVLADPSTPVGAFTAPAAAAFDFDL
ncbi:MAG: hypothetical protein JO144_10100, partial [Actinobacteria bacterium]|nr:hypothetical protein [Actinomycetota bacterium]